MDSGLRGVSAHVLRHTFASVLIYQGRDVAFVARQLGHTTPSTTWDTYIHLFNEAKQADQARDQLDAEFGAVLDGDAVIRRPRALDQTGRPSFGVSQPFDRCGRRDAGSCGQALGRGRAGVEIGRLGFGQLDEKDERLLGGELISGRLELVEPVEQDVDTGQHAPQCGPMAG